MKEERSINAVPVESTFRPAGAGEITVDSGESVRPKIWGKAYPLRDLARRLKFMNASGGSINHYGQKADLVAEELGSVQQVVTTM